MNLGDLRGRLARLTRATMPTQSQLPAGFVDPVAAYVRARIAAGATPTETPTETTSEARAEAEARVTTWLSRGKVRA